MLDFEALILEYATLFKLKVKDFRAGPQESNLRSLLFPIFPSAPMV